MEIVKVSRILGTLTIKELDVKFAKRMMLHKHYSKKWNTSFGVINFGIFKDGECLGAAVFGNLMNPKSYSSIADVEAGQILELNRLWIDDALGKNAESILISSSFKLIKALYPNIKIIQSFADGRLGCGTIYKATNFKYYGYKETLFFENLDSGEVYHNVPLSNTKRPQKILNANRHYIDNELKAFYVKTYRYMYPLYKKINIKLKEEPYPEYDKGVKYVEYKHPIGLMCRLQLMYTAMSDNVYANKSLKELKDRFTKAEIDIEMANQEKNESYIWFKNEYLTTKIRDNLEQKNTLADLFT